MPAAHTQPLAQGFKSADQPGKTRIVIGFHDDQFADVQAFALRNHTSFAEAVRMLCEWGMEAEAQALGQERNRA